MLQKCTDPNLGKVVVGGGSDKKTNFMEPTVVSSVKLDDPLMQVQRQTKTKTKTKAKTKTKTKTTLSTLTETSAW